MGILWRFFLISLLDLDFQSFLFHSHFSENFTLFLEKKEWNLTPSFIKKINHSRRVQDPKQSMSGTIFKSPKFSRNFISRSRSRSFFISFHFHFSISIPSHFYFSFISRSQSQMIFFFTCTSRKEWMAFFLDCSKPTLAGHCFMLFIYFIIKFSISMGNIWNRMSPFIVC